MTDFIYLPVEIKNREFYAKLLLALKCIERGSSVVIGARIPPGHRLLKMARATILYKSAAKVDEDHLLCFAEAGHQVYSLDEEGFLVGSLDFFVNKRFTEKNVRHTAGFFCWGKLQAAALKVRYPDAVDKFSVSGNPRVDLWKNRYFGLYDKEVSRLQREFGDFVFVPSNFAVTSPFKKEGIVTRLKKMGYIDNAEEQAQFQELEEKLKKLREAFAIAIADWSMTLRKFFVIRPHPSEDVGFWVERFKGHPYVRVSSQYSVSPWAMAAKAVLHNSCTTAIESGFYAVPTIAYTPEGMTHSIEKNFANMASHVESDPAAVLALLRRALRGDLQAVAWPDSISGYLSADGDSATIIAERLTATVTAKVSPQFNVNHKALLKRKLIKLIVAVDRRGWLPGLERVKYSLGKFDHTTKAEVREVLQIFSNRHSNAMKILVSEVEPNLFHLSRA